MTYQDFVGVIETTLQSSWKFSYVWLYELSIIYYACHFIQTFLSDLPVFVPDLRHQFSCDLITVRGKRKVKSPFSLSHVFQYLSALTSQTSAQKVFINKKFCIAVEVCLQVVDSKPTRYLFLARDPQHRSQLPPVPLPHRHPHLQRCAWKCHELGLVLSAPASVSNTKIRNSYFSVFHFDIKNKNVCMTQMRCLKTTDF